MATVSFSKSFQISKQETIDKLEKAAQNITPIKVDIDKATENRKRNERKLLSMLRSKA